MEDIDNRKESGNSLLIFMTAPPIHFIRACNRVRRYSTRSKGGYVKHTYVSQRDEQILLGLFSRLFQRKLGQIAATTGHGI